MSESTHIPVLKEEVAQTLLPSPGQTFIDCTFGRGGHTRALVEQCPNIRVIAIDRDPTAREAFRRFSLDFPRTEMVLAPLPFSEALANFEADLLLADLGVSSPQIDTAERGMSYRLAGPLDLRMNTSEGETAAAWLAKQKNAGDIAAVLQAYGEEPLAFHIAVSILRYQEETGPIEETSTLVRIVESVYKHKYRHRSRTPPAAKTFQALRILVNHELEELSALLALLPHVLRPAGRAVILSYHSLEDRLVKHCFQRGAKECLCPPGLPVCRCGHQASWKLLKPFPAYPSEAEKRLNPRSHSAMMRAVEAL